MKKLTAKELRIGNYVTWEDDDIDNIILQVTGIFDNGELLVKYKYTSSLFHEIDTDIEDVKPIELTEKWLIDFGFRKDEETNYRWFMEDWLAYDLDDNCIRTSDSWEFGKKKYVHELQNLYFSLTGKELNQIKTSHCTG